MTDEIHKSNRKSLSDYPVPNAKRFGDVNLRSKVTLTYRDLCYNFSFR